MCVSLALKGPLSFGQMPPDLSEQFIHAGLGVGIIVGAAAFNLLATSAVCVLVPKHGTVKRFENLGVYVVELIWSLWAYVWLWIVLKVTHDLILRTSQFH